MHQLKSITLPHDLSTFSEIIDVRSPEEFEIDHIPGAINLPALDNHQRKHVGTIYKNNPFEARKVGASHISNNVSRHLTTHLADKPTSYRPLLYCWRGGMRSRSFTFILQSIGWEAHIIQGGYRAFRKFNVQNLQEILANPDLQFHVFSGLTGTGKTRLLHALEDQGAQILDLEALANHKGSLLGNHPTDPQPSQKAFETHLWHTLSGFDPTQPIFTEAESNRIGRLHMPPSLWQKLGQGTVTNLELPLPERAKLLAQDYPHFLENPTTLSDLLNTLRRIRGNEQIDTWQTQIENQDWQTFLTSILENHYDLAYRPPGHEKSNYPQLTKTIHLKNHQPATYQTIAKKILQNPTN